MSGTPFFTSGKEQAFQGKEKPADVRNSNIIAAKAVADAIRTSLGPRGMDKMIQASKGEVTITNDGATILKQMQVIHPAAQMLVELAKAQDVEAGDGTTTVVILAGSLLSVTQSLLSKGIHPTSISESFQTAAVKSLEYLDELAIQVDLTDKATLIKIAATSLSSKVVSEFSGLLAPITVEAVLKCIDIATSTNVDLKDIKVITKLGGTLEDTELVEGVVFDKKASHAAGSVLAVDKAKIGLIQFCISLPKTDMENQVIVSDYTQMDRILREERNYILEICKQIKKAGCNVLLIQKSILRDATNELALHYLAKMKVMVVRDIEREDIEFICKSLGCRPIASLDHFLPECLSSAERVEEVSVGGSKIVKVTGPAIGQKTVSILVRGSNKLILDEADRSIHDALCVLRCLVKKRALVPGGGAPEIHVALRLQEHARTLRGMDAYCCKAFADALEIIPFTLAENAGLSPIAIVTELRNRHARGEHGCGINVRKGQVGDMREEQVVQPLLVTSSAISLAAETVRSILKIDDILNAQHHV